MRILSITKGLFAAAVFLPMLSLPAMAAVTVVPKIDCELVAGTVMGVPVTYCKCRIKVDVTPSEPSPIK